MKAAEHPDHAPLSAINRRQLTLLEGLFGSMGPYNGHKSEIGVSRGVVGSCSFMRMTANRGLNFSKTWRQVSNDGSDVAVLCLVEKGRMRLHRAGSEYAVDSGTLVIFKSAMPFSVAFLPDQDGCQMLYLTVPMHRMRKLLDSDFLSVVCELSGGKKLSMALRMIKDLFEVKKELQLPLVEHFLDLILLMIGEVVKDHEPRISKRRSLVERRYDDILRYIDTHLSDSSLSLAAVAQACGISQRYVWKLLKDNETTFSELLWSTRLKAASEWLTRSNASEVSVSEIAYGVGFKSPAHFCRLFKRAYRQTPTEYRSRRKSVIFRQPVNVADLYQPDAR